MAKTRDIRRRIKSVSSTTKITRTMEMVATVRSKKAQERLKGALPFCEQLTEMAGRLIGAGEGASTHPLFRRAPRVKRAAVLVITSDRGLCGGYNTGVLAAARAEVRRLRGEGVEVELDVTGKRGVSTLRFQGFELHKTAVGIDDRVKFGAVEPMAQEYIDRFLAGALDEVRIVSARYRSATQQKPAVSPLLPVEPPTLPAGGAHAAWFEFHPSPEAILASLVPFEVKTSLFTRFLEAGASEQIARRLAMKAATDNAIEMMKLLRQKYNRARQSQITMELSDILGGVAAVKG
ncbi:MAG: ATP synthase F1 subunit gamma [Planctomycetes bacterium]|jgi:F-type H+-transporting ATPase subunit gamma|nr:ATP synthase F1 subunit gamma [Planctomycetota bacterium]